MRPRILFLGGSDGAMLARAAEMGLEIFVVANREPIGIHDVWLRADCYNEADTLQATSGLAGMSAVMCAGTDAPDVAAAIAVRLGEPIASNTPSLDTAVFSKNKYAQYELLIQNGVRVPFTSLWESQPREWSGPVIVKPGNARGARGVLRFASWRDMPEATYSEVASWGLPVLRQNYIEGPQFSSESLVQDGKILWTAYAERNYKRLAEFSPNVIEDGCDMPPLQEDYGEPGWRNLAEIELQKCVKALGLRRGTLKGDLVWDGVHIWVIEVACRLGGGGLASEMVPRVWGIDHAGLAIRLALGDTIWPGEIRPWRRCRARQRYAFPVRPFSHQERGERTTQFYYP